MQSTPVWEHVNAIYTCVNFIYQLKITKSNTATSTMMKSEEKRLCSIWESDL